MDDRALYLTPSILGRPFSPYMKGHEATKSTVLQLYQVEIEMEITLRPRVVTSPVPS